MTPGTQPTSKPIPARIAYKQVFARLYPMEALGERSLTEALAMLPDGHLSIRLLGAPELVDVGAHEAATSKIVLSGDLFPQSVETPDARYSAEIEKFVFQGVSEYWLIHTDRASGKFKRAKLNSEDRPDSRPRVTVSPNGSFFIVGQFGDGEGWYEQARADILMTSNAEAIITVGVSHETSQKDAQRFSVNAFQSIPLKMG